MKPVLGSLLLGENPNVGSGLFSVSYKARMRIVIVSNRLPFQVSIKEGAPRFQGQRRRIDHWDLGYIDRANSNGAEIDHLWVGWPGTNVEAKLKPAVTKYAQSHYKALPVFLSEKSVDCFYHGFCNKTLWPLFHYFPTLARYEEDYWQEYQSVNRPLPRRCCRCCGRTIWCGFTTTN